MAESKTIKEFISILGESNVTAESSELESYSVDGLVPKAVLFPETERQISEIMKVASRESVSIMPMGSGTKRSLGNIPPQLDVLLSTQKLNLLLEHEARDLVATTQCGVTLENFQNKLKDDNQFLPVNPMHAACGATLGGIIASNSSGPLRLRYGTLRELLIGIRVVRADGTVFKGGSKVVKNVAGYDLPKLYVGSLGTLGIITEATLRLYSIPERSETYLVSFTTLEKCSEATVELLKSDLVMNSLELLNPALAREVAERTGIELKRRKYALAIRVMNVDKAVSEQMSLVKKVCNKGRGQGVTVDGAEEEKLWEEIVNYPWNTTQENMVKLKAGVLITDVPRVFSELEEHANQKDVTVYASSKAGNGIVDITLKGELSSLSSLVKNLRIYTASLGVSLVIEAAPPDLKSGVDVWGGMGSGLALMKRIKSNFDPAGILNPGRYI
jgi:glycolate dehydrogenase FAD-binding subunit